MTFSMVIGRASWTMENFIVYYQLERVQQ